jgi:hypothetical protein
MNVYVVFTSFLLHFDYGRMSSLVVTTNSNNCRKITLQAADQQRNNEDTGPVQNTEDHVLDSENSRFCSANVACTGRLK